MSAPRLEVRLDRLQHNARQLVDRLAPKGIAVTGVTKATLGSPEVAAALFAGGVAAIGESRVENLERLAEAGIDAPTVPAEPPAASGDGQSGRATLYRTLEILASLGILSRILNESGRPLYVAGAPVHRHHLICSGCGAVVPFSACPVGDLAAALAQESGFEVHGHLLEIFGTCRTCQSAPR